MLFSRRFHQSERHTGTKRGRKNTKKEKKSREKEKEIKLKTFVVEIHARRRDSADSHCTKAP